MSLQPIKRIPVCRSFASSVRKVSPGNLEWGPRSSLKELSRTGGPIEEGRVSTVPLVLVGRGKWTGGQYGKRPAFRRIPRVTRCLHRLEESDW